MQYSFECKINELFIMITSDYIEIATVPFTDLVEDDYVISTDQCSDTVRYVGYDRADGINYYKHYADKTVVDAIEQLIKQHNLYICAAGDTVMRIPVDDDDLTDEPLKIFVG